MDTHDEGESATCGVCGARTGTGKCAACGDSQRSGLRVLPPLRGGITFVDHEVRVRLVREWKGPTVRDLVAAIERPECGVQSGARSALRAIEAGDLAKADAALEATVGRILPGPGARKATRDWSMILLVWLWCTLLFVAFVLALGGGE